MKLIFAMPIIFLASVSQGADFFINSTTELADGKKVEIVCERDAGKSNPQLTETNMPQAGNKLKAYQIHCGKGPDSFGISFKHLSTETITAVGFKPYDGTQLYGDVKTPVFTYKVKAGGNILEVNSFKGDPQHYKADGTTLKITEFKEETDDKLNTFHVIVGNGTGDFELKKLKNGVGAAGKVTYSFRVRIPYKPSKI